MPLNMSNGTARRPVDVKVTRWIVAALAGAFFACSTTAELNECVEFAGRTEFTVSVFVSKTVGEELALNLDDEIETQVQGVIEGGGFRFHDQAKSHISIDVTATATEPSGIKGLLVTLRVWTLLPGSSNGDSCLQAATIWQVNDVRLTTEKAIGSDTMLVVHSLTKELLRIIVLSNPSAE